MDYSIKSVEEKQTGEGFVFDVGSLYAALEKLTDGRKARGLRYKLVTILTIVILAKLAGEDEPLGISEWAKHRAVYLVEALGLTRTSMPHEVTYSRVLGEAVDPEELEQVVSEYWHQKAQLSVLINIDGKALRGTIPAGKTQGVHLLAAYLPEEGIVLMQMEVEKKENEIVVAPKLLKCLDLEGRIVTGDAMFAQRKLSIQIVEAGGDYIWTVKANQASLLGDIVRLFEPAYCPAGTSPMHDDFCTEKTIDTGHGRVETRTITTSSMLEDYSDWPYLGQVFKLERKVLHLSTGKETFEVAYGVTSLSASQASPNQLLHLTRRHWAIENELHYPRDVTFNEDRCRLKIGHAARSMAIINNLVIGLINQLDFRYMPQARRFFNAHFHAALDLVLCP